MNTTSSNAKTLLDVLEPLLELGCACAIIDYGARDTARFDIHVFDYNLDENGDVQRGVVRRLIRLEDSGVLPLSMLFTYKSGAISFDARCNIVRQSKHVFSPDRIHHDT